MKILFQLALKEILGHRRFSMFFVLNISIGMIAFTCLDAFKNSFNDSLKSSSKLILTADLSVSARRLVNDDEKAIAKKILPQDTLTTTSTKLYSMVTANNKSRLLNIVAIDKDYPFYGHFTLEKGGVVVSDSSKEILNKALVWVYPETLSQLNVKVGEKIKIGIKEFEISDVILDESSADFSGLSFAPKLYISSSFLEETNLIQKGSTLWNTVYYKLSAPSTTEHYAKLLNDELQDPGIRVRTPEMKSQRSGVAISYLLDYLGLVSLAGFLIAALGIGYFYFIFFGKRLKDLVVFRALGLTPKQVIRIFVFQVLFLGMFSSLISLFVSFFMIKTFPLIFTNLLPLEIVPELTYKTVFICLFMSTLGSIFICYPLISKIKYLKPTDLFRENSRISLPLNKNVIINYLPALILYWVISMWQAQSWIVGTIFFISFFGSGIFLTLLYLLILNLIKYQNTMSKHISFHLAIKYLTRKPFHSLIAFLALSMGVLLINFVNQIKSGLYNELSPVTNQELPNFFMFDIQDEQVTDLKKFLSTNKLTLAHISPMIQARLEKVNNELFSKPNIDEQRLTREEEQSYRLKNRGFNLSFRKKLSTSEAIVDGYTFSEKKQTASGLPKISVEQRFANRLNFKVGDILEFSIQGVNVAGEVVNLRHVRWSSFQPNFFIQFEDGVINEAPKTWVASITGVEDQQIELFQNKLTDFFPNISIIDVKRLSQKIIDISDKMIQILNFMAIITFIIGFIILISICQNQSKLRQWDLNLLKILGSSKSVLQKCFYLEFGLLCFFASVMGTLFAILISIIISANIFDNIYLFDWKMPILSIIALTFLGMLISHFSLNKIISKKSVLTLTDR